MKKIVTLCMLLALWTGAIADMELDGARWMDAALMASRLRRACISVMVGK